MTSCDWVENILWENIPSFARSSHLKTLIIYHHCKLAIRIFKYIFRCIMFQFNNFQKYVLRNFKMDYLTGFKIKHHWYFPSSKMYANTKYGLIFIIFDKISESLKICFKEFHDFKQEISPTCEWHRRRIGPSVEKRREILYEWRSRQGTLAGVVAGAHSGTRHREMLDTQFFTTFANFDV